MLVLVAQKKKKIVSFLRCEQIAFNCNWQLGEKVNDVKFMATVRLLNILKKCVFVANFTVIYFIPSLLNNY